MSKSPGKISRPFQATNRHAPKQFPAHNKRRDFAYWRCGNAALQAVRGLSAKARPHPFAPAAELR